MMSLHEVAKELFKRFDQENKGFITVDQLRNCNISSDQSEFTDGEILSIFSAIDKQQRGSVTLEEFISAFLYTSGAHIESFDDRYSHDCDEIGSLLNSEDVDLYETNSDQSDISSDSEEIHGDRGEIVARDLLNKGDSGSKLPCVTSPDFKSPLVESYAEENPICCESPHYCETNGVGSSSIAQNCSYASPNRLLRQFSETLWTRFQKSDAHVLPASKAYSKPRHNLARLRKWRSCEAELFPAKTAQLPPIDLTLNSRLIQNGLTNERFEKTIDIVAHLEEVTFPIVSKGHAATIDVGRPCSRDGLENGELASFSKTKTHSRSSVTREFDEIFGLVDASRSPSIVLLDGTGPEQVFIDHSGVGGTAAKALEDSAFGSKSLCGCSCHGGRIINKSSSLSPSNNLTRSKGLFSRSSSSLHCVSFSSNQTPLGRLSKAHSSIDLTSASINSMEEVPDGSICDGDDEEEDISGASLEDWQWYLKKIGGTSLFSSNQTLRYVWGQIIKFHHHLLHPLDDFLKSVISEFQAAYSTCVELENAIHSKQELHEKELAALYEEVENALAKEKDALNDKHSEREEYFRSEMALLSDAKERALKEQAREARLLEDQIEHLVKEVNTLRMSSENTEKAFQELSKTERRLRREIFELTQENLRAEQQLQAYEKTVRELQNCVNQMSNEYEVEKANHARIARKYQDLVEEKEYLDQNINTISMELDELRSKRSPRRLDKWSVVSEEYESEERHGKKRKPTLSATSLSLSPRASLSPCDLSMSPPPLWLDHSMAPKGPASPDICFVPSVFSSPFSASSSAKSPPASPLLPGSVSPIPGTSSPASPLLPESLSPIPEKSAPALSFLPGSVSPIPEKSATALSLLPESVSPIPTSAAEEPCVSATSSKGGERNASDISDEQFLKSSTPVKSACIRLASTPGKDFKVIFCGDYAVGKSSVIRRMCGETYLRTRQSTAHPDCYSKIFSHEGAVVKMRVWDTVGQERFGSIPTSYYRRSDVVILVYDITRRRSLVGLIAWLEDIREFCESNTLFVVLGNKVDINHNRKVKYADGQSFAKDNDAIFLETSARTGENIELMCKMIASTLVEQKDYVFVRSGLQQTLLTNDMHRRKPCCQAS